MSCVSSENTFDQGGHALETAILQYMAAVQEHLSETASAFDLTPQQAFALRAIDAAPSMSGLAELMHCDASNVTGIVDRLEGRGLIERTTDRGDRRIKRLVVTEAGRAQRERLETQLLTSFPGLARLNDLERDTLFGLLHRALGFGESPLSQH